MKKDNPICPYNSGVNCNEVNEFSKKCLGCGWNTDLNIGQKRLDKMRNKNKKDSFIGNIFGEQEK